MAHVFSALLTPEPSHAVDTPPGTAVAAVIRALHDSGWIERPRWAVFSDPTGQLGKKDLAFDALESHIGAVMADHRTFAVTLDTYESVTERPDSIPVLTPDLTDNMSLVYSEVVLAAPGNETGEGPEAPPRCRSCTGVTGIPLKQHPSQTAARICNFLFAPMFLPATCPACGVERVLEDVQVKVLIAGELIEFPTPAFRFAVVLHSTEYYGAGPMPVVDPGLLTTVSTVTGLPMRQIGYVDWS